MVDVIDDDDDDGVVLGNEAQTNDERISFGHKQEKKNRFFFVFVSFGLDWLIAFGWLVHLANINPSTSTIYLTI